MFVKPNSFLVHSVAATIVEYFKDHGHRIFDDELQIQPIDHLWVTKILELLG